MLYIHPPLAIASYVFIFLFAAFVIKNNFQPKKVKIAGLTAWVLALLGLLTGMLWAQIAWGSYWSWDLKESLTLALFLSLTATQVAYFEKNQKATQWLSMITCALMLATALSSFIVVGLHSFL
jgi:ABC-type transport system involved in cytochrome c biogenesis permease subunit